MIFKKKSTSDFDFPLDIEINDNKYFIDVVFLPKKSSSVVIKENRLVFRMSQYLSGKLAQEHFSHLLKRIYNKIQSNIYKKNINTIDKVLKEGCFYFSGEKYLFEYSSKIRSVKLENNTFYLNPSLISEIVEKYVIKYLILRYKKIMENYVNELSSKTYNFKINGFLLKMVNSKWGHCTHDNKIMLNLKLLNAKKEILDYVIIHELAHIRHKNHSKSFWNEVEKYCSNYKKLRKYLKANPPEIFIDGKK